MATFKITLRTKEGDDTIHTLRAALKILGRRFGLCTIKVEEANDNDNSIVRSKCDGTNYTRCGNAMTWDEQRRQFGRLMRNGLSLDEAKAVASRCQKCTTDLFRSYEINRLDGQSNQ